MIKDLYSKIVFKYTKYTLFFIFLLVGFLAFEAFKLEVDASAKTLLLENDKDLAYSREVYKRYKSQDLLMIAYTPKSYLLSDDTLKNIKKISSDLQKLPLVDSVNTILNIPLLETSKLSFEQLAEGAKTLETKGINKDEVKKELLNNPLYIENFVSPDFKTTSIMINLKDNFSKDVQHKNIVEIRSIMKKYQADADMFLGGANMIADDMISYVKSDLKNYGVIVLFLLILILYVVFKEIKWVLLPLIILFAAIVSSIGLLGLFEWQVTVVSSNFISFQLILTTSIIIHLVVRYRELASNSTKLIQKDLILKTVSSMVKPTFFAVITTIAGFSSLVLSGILPVINLGWMMSASLVLSFFLTYILFGSLMVFLKPSPPNKTFEKQFAITQLLSNIVQKHYKAIFILSFLTILFSISGASKLVVENSFINYFKSSTEIFQGMSIIDKQLGGTTPLDVTIDLIEDTTIQETSQKQKNSAFGEFEENMLDDFENEFETKEQENQYWFTSTKMQKIEKIHAYLESIPELGKVLSFGTVLRVGKTINNNEDLGNFQLALLYNEFPDDLKKQILNPYLSIKDNQVRFTIRIVDSNPDLRRDELLKKIRAELHEKVGIKKEHIHLSGLMVLYNNMLQSLFKSQILTLSVMVILLFVMFWSIFKSFRIGLAAIIANIIPIGIVFGFMGWFSIPLDMMTITIASISIGIAVDDTIHYLYRYKNEYLKFGNYIDAMQSSHTSIGHAMTYTSLAISIGFLVLVLSEFTPTIYFGLLTVVAMLVALATDLLLLPRLVISLNAFKGVAKKANSTF
ncbi:MMPL family transporter [Sulfurimonas lithotrophica]|uniref:MMPL family transporter n=1 Tax=Sulfurimonas lithotrophica TaxID=2590022 RepID=A0A5P8P3S1_9BACT|nr:MMPL family transporter [Sulfurimonas lithotrophica]QFR50339.1 MMPL family transporter [Sulfurimonas lithotrophica]